MGRGSGTGRGGPRSTGHQPYGTDQRRAGPHPERDHQRAVLFGGFDGTNYLADTWTWDGTTWTEQTPATSPPARAGATMEYFDGQVVLFGGYNGTSYLNDTWTWDGTTWTEQSGTNPRRGPMPPRPRTPDMQRAPGPWCFSVGTTAPATSVTRGLTPRPGGPSRLRPPAPRPGPMRPWPTTAPWPSPPSSAATTAAPFSPTPGSTRDQLGGTVPTANPPARTDAAMADNSTDGQLVLFGGQATTTTSSTLGDTWTFYSAPDAPTGVTATAAGGQATVTFNAVPFYGDGGYTITSYTVTSSPGSQTCTVTPTGTPPATYNCTVTGLTNGTSYTFTVTSTNFQGTGLPSTPSTAVVPADGARGSDHRYRHRG